MVNPTATDQPLDGIGVASFGNEYEILGGWDGNTFPFSVNSIYRTTNGGASFTKTFAPWDPRHSFGCGNDGNLNTYVVGSDLQPLATDTNRKECWMRPFGGSFTLMNDDCPWGPRVLMGFCIDANNFIYVFGGQVSYDIVDGVFDDVWQSKDEGRSWEMIASGLPFLSGLMAGHVTYFNRQFHAVCAGGYYDNNQDNRTFSSEHWVSDNAIDWVQLPDFPGLPRHYINMSEDPEEGILWLINGNTIVSGGAFNLQEAWYWNGHGWGKIRAKPVNATHATGVCFSQGRIFISCGNLFRTVSKLERYPIL